MRLRAWLPYLLLVPPAVSVLVERDRFPEWMPVHWGANGVANGFVLRSTESLLAPVVFLAVLILLLDGTVAVGGRVGPPEVTERVRRILEPIRWTLALFGFPAAFVPLWGPVPALVWTGVMLVVVAIQVVRSLRQVPRSPGGPRRALVYSNASDPRVIVPRSSGQGWTFNFARPSAWVLMLILLTGPALAVALAVRQIQQVGPHHGASAPARSP